MGRQKKSSILSSYEQAILLGQPNRKAPTGLRNLCMLNLMLKAGLRAGEIINLLEEDINWEEKKILVRESGAANRRNLWLDDEDIALLESWRKTRTTAGKYFFTTLKGARINDRYLREMVKRLGKKAGIKKDVYPHLLRSTFAANLIRETRNLELVQEALGHRDSSTTRSYVELLLKESDQTLFQENVDRRSGIPVESAEQEQVRQNETGAKEAPQQAKETSAASIWHIMENETGGKEGEALDNKGNKKETNRDNKEQEKKHKPVELEAENTLKKEKDIQESSPCRIGQGQRRAITDAEGNIIIARSVESDASREDKTGQSDKQFKKTGQTSTNLEWEKTVKDKNPIPPLKCSNCDYILRFRENCPQCGIEFNKIIEHWGKNV